MKTVISIPDELDIGGVIREGAEEYVSYVSFEEAAVDAGIAAWLEAIV